MGWGALIRTQTEVEKKQEAKKEDNMQEKREKYQNLIILS